MALYDRKCGLFIAQEQHERCQPPIRFGNRLPSYYAKILAVLTTFYHPNAALPLLRLVTSEPVYPLLICIPDAGYVNEALPL